MPANAITQISSGSGVGFPNYSLRDINSASGYELRRTSVTQISGMGFGAKQARFVPLPEATSLDDISADSLVDLDWDSAQTTFVDDGAFTEQKFCAVRIYTDESVLNPGQAIYHYAKLRVYTDGGVKIDWVTYRFDIEPSNISAALGDIRDLLVDEDRIYLSIDMQGFGMLGYVQRTIDGYKPQYSLDVVPVSGPMENPQQMASDEVGGVFIVAQDKLWWIQPELKQFEVLSGLSNGVAVLFKQVEGVKTIYVADDSGVYEIDASSFDYGNAANDPPTPLILPVAPTFAFEDGVIPGFLSWADEARTSLLFADRNNNIIRRLDLASGEFSEEVSTGGATPWGVARVNDNRFYVGCETEIDLYERLLLVQEGAHALGIGLIPFQYINGLGLADTSSAQGYYFWQYPGLPFGGTLSLQINHELCRTNNISYFTVHLDNFDMGTSRQIGESYVDLLWGEQNGNYGFWPMITSGPKYPVRAEGALWYNGHLGAKITTNLADTGTNLMRVVFYNSDNQVVDQFEKIILIDNTVYHTKLFLPRIGSGGQAPAPGVYPTLECGCLTFASKDDLLELDFAAWHPQGVGNYYVNIYRSGNIANLAQVGPVSSYEQLNTKSTTAAANPIRVGHIVGDCDIANVTIRVSAPSRVTNGYGWVQLGAWSQLSFTLLMGTLTHTPWAGEP
ncbi:MAG: hypothetical protein KC457_00035 [Myxococcales bacterium]|nr:hypothetical protein [Myxococcales bacterium]